jgi:hypothetical protein
MHAADAPRARAAAAPVARNRLFRSPRARRARVRRERREETSRARRRGVSAKRDETRLLLGGRTRRWKVQVVPRKVPNLRWARGEVPLPALRHRGVHRRALLIHRRDLRVALERPEDVVSAAQRGHPRLSEGEKRDSSAVGPRTRATTRGTDATGGVAARERGFV